jgi:hypothetical protein
MMRRNILIYCFLDENATIDGMPDEVKNMLDQILYMETILFFLSGSNGG